MHLREKLFSIRDYDLAATLNSGQAFRWRPQENGWEGIIGQRWVRLEQQNHQIFACTIAPDADWSWLSHYLQLELAFPAVLASFPKDEPLRTAVAACRGLRLLRQDPWECLASFILSSTKQIIQIRQIIALLCSRHGEALPVPPGHDPVHTFPSAKQLAQLSEQDLRDCKMGFRAPYLLAAARSLAEGKMDLASLQKLTLAEARAELLKLNGVGPKIADCVLLFAYDFPAAFPVDVWVMKALRELYFPRRQPSRRRLQQFVGSYFGPQAGYAQQYLFHYMRIRRNVS